MGISRLEAVQIRGLEHRYHLLVDGTRMTAVDREGDGTVDTAENSTLTSHFKKYRSEIQSLVDRFRTTLPEKLKKEKRCWSDRLYLTTSNGIDVQIDSTKEYAFWEW